MTDLLTDIDCLISACIPSIKCWGLARLVEYDNEQLPTSYKQDGSQGEKITPNDRYGVAFYHRLLDVSGSDNDTFSFGRNDSILLDQKIRTILIVDIKKGDKVIDNFIGAFAGQPITNSNYKYVELGTSYSITKDSNVIWDAEWSKAYKDKYQMRYLLYAIEYSIQYLTCQNCECD